MGLSLVFRLDGRVAPQADLTHTLKAIASELDYPMLVVTSSAGNELSGCLVGFSTQCSIDPFRMAVFISSRNHTLAVALRSSELAVHFLATHQEHLARLFGELTGDRTDKFSKCAWHFAENGAPILDEVARWLSGPILRQFPAGDHHCFIIEPTLAFAGDGWEHQYGFQQARKLEPGHPP